MSEIWHKTVFLLDHTYQMRESCGVPLDLDASVRPPSRSTPGQQFVPSFIAPTSKSLWTCVVENTLEYSRILWDVFSDQRLIRVLLSNPQSTETLNGWERAHQNITVLGEAFAKAGQPLKNVGKVDVGMKSAIAALGEPTEAQMQSLKNSYNSKVINKGRVICFTSYHAESDLQDLFRTTLSQHNKTEALGEGALPIHECEFILVNVHPVGKERKGRAPSRTCNDVSSTLKMEAWVTGADVLYDRIVELVTQQHDLVVTNITGIPMKEEQNSTSSSNYDVPLFHPRMPTTSLETTTLKWSTPTAHKGPGLGTTHPCSCACRITPVDVNSRPSTCLSNFVLGGRSVWLDMTKKGKSISHVLTAHAGEMWMHILETSRNILEDPPSISEGIGGRVTDYRIPDFVEFMRMNILVPHPSSAALDLQKRRLQRSSSVSGSAASSIGSGPSPMETAKARLAKKTAYWPMTMGGSVLFSVSMYVDSILTLMQKDTLTDAERMEVESKIYSLIGIEARGEPPPIPSPHHKKGKREEQWRSVYNELELFLRGNLHSEGHQKVLECFLTSCRNQENGVKGQGPMNLALSSMPLLTDSPGSPPQGPPAKRPRTDDGGPPVGGAGRLSLLDLWKRKTEKTKVVTLGTLKLYPNRSEDKGREKGVKITEA